MKTIVPILLLLFCCSGAMGVPLVSPPDADDPFGDSWFVSFGATVYTQSKGQVNPVIDVFGATPWWKPAERLPAFRISTAVSYNTQVESMFYDLFAGVRTSKVTSFNVGLAAFDFGGYEVRPFVSMLIGVPISEHFFAGAFMAARPENDWALDGAFLIRINVHSWSGKKP